MSKLADIILLASRGYSKKEINDLLKEENEDINVESSPNATDPAEELIEEMIKETELDNQPVEQAHEEDAIDYKFLYEEEKKKVLTLQENARRVNVESNEKPKDVNDILAEIFI